MKLILLNNILIGKRRHILSFFIVKTITAHHFSIGGTGEHYDFFFDKISLILKGEFVENCIKLL